MNVDPRLIAALRAQLARRRKDAGRVGWKYGSGEAERIRGEIAVGNLTTATTLEDGETYRGGGDLHADAGWPLNWRWMGESPAMPRRSRSVTSHDKGLLRKS